MVELREADEAEQLASRLSLPDSWLPLGHLDLDQSERSLDLSLLVLRPADLVRRRLSSERGLCSWMDQAFDASVPH